MIFTILLLYYTHIYILTLSTLILTWILTRIHKQQQPRYRVPLKNFVLHDYCLAFQFYIKVHLFKFYWTCVSLSVSQKHSSVSLYEKNNKNWKKNNKNNNLSLHPSTHAPIYYFMCLWSTQIFVLSACAACIFINTYILIF